MNVVKKDGLQAWWATILLLAIYVFSFVDRQILNLLVDPIKAELALSDSQIGILQGIAFAATYVFFSIPLGRWVDRRSRNRLITWGVAVWSLATCACGLADNFATLFVARALVGIGEATLTPAAWSLLSDYFSPARRALPFSIFLTGPYLGVGAAMIAGGALVGVLPERFTWDGPIALELSRWQQIFFLVGAPGLIFTVLMLATPEPPRGGGGTAGTGDAAVPYRAIIAHLAAHRAVYGALLVGTSFLVFALYAVQSWAPAFLHRAHGLSVTEVGVRYGTIALVAGALGVLTSPLYGRLLRAARREHYYLLIPLGAACALVPLAVLLPLAPGVSSALALIACISYLVTVPLAPVALGLQAVTPPGMRGVVVGGYVVATNILGLGAGPYTVGLVNDLLFADPAQIGASLGMSCAFAAAIALLLFLWGERVLRARPPRPV
ncbi:MAG: MFS transporter [Porticoccaceae bacterium]|nr:MAG: MFS transporter [Porticoccaceae bacterium]